VSLGPPVGAIEELAQADIIEVNKPYANITVSKNTRYLLSFKNFNNLTTQLTEQKSNNSISNKLNRDDFHQIYRVYRIF
jgi:hypothetical protein